MAKLPQEVEQLLKQIEADTCVGFSDVSACIQFPLYRKDISAVIVHPREMSLISAKSMLRSKLRKVNWQCSEMNNRPSLMLLAPMLFASVDVAYHATRFANVPSILRSGLLPSIPARSNTERADCEGNIYVCADLGALPDDPNEEPPKETAHWWRWHLSHNNRFDDAKWCILRVVLAGLTAPFYRDIWSRSGLIIEGDASVPPERLSVEWKH